MPEDFFDSKSTLSFAHRRKADRVILNSVVYVELGPGNGGLALNLCEDGIAVQAAEPILGADFPRLRFCLPNSTKWIEVEGKLVWEGASRKEAGIQFIRLSADARAQIRNYLKGANAPLEAAADVSSPDVAEVAEQDPHSLELAQKEVDLSAELDSMFPSEKEVSPGKVPLVQRSAEFFPPEAAPQAPSSRNRVPLEPAVGTLESDISLEAQVSPTQSDLHRHPASAHPRPVVGVDQAQQVESSRTQFNPESTSSEHGPKMPVPSFRHAPPTPSPNSSRNSSPNSSVDPEADRATHERLVAAFAEASNSPSAHPNTPLQARLSNRSAHGPSAPPPIPLSGFGYQPSEFEEPFGKKWIGIAVVLAALLAVGVVFAVGPANVKDLIFRRHAIFESLAGPPPPTLPEKQTGKPDAAANPTANDKSAPPADSPVALPPDTLEVRGSQNASPRTADPAPTVDSPAKNSDGQYGGEDTADPEAEVLEFQREHSQGNSNKTDSYGASTDASTPYPKPNVSAAFVPPVASTADPRGNSPAARSASEANRAPAEELRSTAQTQQPGAGVVAIRSSFHAVRGIDTQASETSESSLNNQPIVPGQLKTMRQPNYPVEALRAHIEGTVTLRATVDRTGAVEAVQLIGGPPILVPAAIEAVRQWRYAPTTSNGQAVECTQDISVVFRMANSVSASH